MANTTFTGPVISLNGFSGTVLTVASATIDNLVCSTLTIGSTQLTNGSVSGTVATQAGRIPVLVGSTTLYIALYSSLTP
jgi:hypothetical protein